MSTPIDRTIARHAGAEVASGALGPQVREGRRLVRHSLAARVYHWSMAAAVLVLLGTGFLPLLGIHFAWVTIHWVAGVVLLVLVLYHVVRSLRRQRWRLMWVGRRDLRDIAASSRWMLGGGAPPRPGKYQLSQKLFHHGVALVVLTTVVTGIMMMTRIDSPLWNRNPYWLSDAAWGWVYVLHGFAALATITMVMLHVYFALRPEKLWLTRSMIQGWIPHERYRQHHDTKRWQIDE